MELVKFRKNGGSVSICIYITGLIAWRYVYVADKITFVNNSQSSNPKAHMLGLPHDLQNDVNSWDIQLGNYSTGMQDYEIEIIWKQDETTLYTWKRQGQLPKDKARVETDDALLIGIE